MYGVRSAPDQPVADLYHKPNPVSLALIQKPQPI